jgi:hypothetical protein
MSKRKAEDNETQVTKKQKTVKLNGNARFFRWACTRTVGDNAWKEWKLINNGPWGWRFVYADAPGVHIRNPIGSCSVFDLHAQEVPLIGCGQFHLHDPRDRLPFSDVLPDDIVWVRVRLTDHMLDYIEEKGIRVRSALERTLPELKGSPPLREIIFDYAVPTLIVVYYAVAVSTGAVAQFDDYEEQLKHHAKVELDHLRSPICQCALVSRACICSEPANDWMSMMILNSDLLKLIRKICIRTLCTHSHRRLDIPGSTFLALG